MCKQEELKSSYPNIISLSRLSVKECNVWRIPLDFQAQCKYLSLCPRMGREHRSIPWTKTRSRREQSAFRSQADYQACRVIAIQMHFDPVAVSISKQLKIAQRQLISLITLALTKDITGVRSFTRSNTSDQAPACCPRGNFKQQTT